MQSKENIPPAMYIPINDRMQAFTTSTNPATSAAVSTAIVNVYEGVVITTSTTGNSQTLQAPTPSTGVRYFTVINNDTSTNSIPVVANSITYTVTPGESQSFVWDGSAWGPTDLGITAIPVTIAQGGTGQATAQLAINALTAVSGATNEYVLTKDTSTGNATFKANVGGIPVAAAGGTVDAITADYTPDVALADLKMVAVVAAGANTSATPSFAPDGLTAHTIVKNGGQALVAGDISAAGHVIILEYNLASTRWELLNPKVPVAFDPAAPGAIGGTTPAAGTFTTLLGLNKETTISATGNLVAANMKGNQINNFGQADDATLTMDAAAEGLYFTVCLGTTIAKYFHLDPAAGDSIYLDGVTTGDGKYVGVASATIDYEIQFKAIKTGASAYDWSARTVLGPWTAEA